MHCSQKARADTLHAQTFDNYVASVDHAPFSRAGPPPSNLTHVVARAVISSSSATSGRATRSSKRAQHASPTSSVDSDSAMSDAESSRENEVQKWRHGLKSTRVKILALGECPITDRHETIRFLTRYIASQSRKGSRRLKRLRPRRIPILRPREGRWLVRDPWTFFLPLETLASSLGTSKAERSSCRAS